MSNNKALRKWSGGELNPWFDFERPFADMFKGFFDEFPTSFQTVSEKGFSPGINIEEKDDCYLVTAEVPDMSEDDLDVSCDNERLTISGHKKEDYDKTDKGVHYVGRSYGSFKKSIPLNCEVEQENIKAELDKGVLRLVLPKSQKAENQPKKIEVKSK